jgi:uncharacterized lipoprotein YmbA
MHVRLKSILVFITLGVLAEACSPLAPRPDLATYFVLTPLSEGPGGATPSSLAGAESPLTIGIGPIDFPDYLRRTQMVMRAEPNRIDISQHQSWAEPLDKNFARVLSQNLAELLNTHRIEKYPWLRRTEVDYQIAIDVYRFETTADGKSMLSAQWVIRDGRNGKDLYAFESKIAEPVGPGSTGASAALSSDLGELSKRIASRVTVLSHARKPASIEGKKATTDANC